VRFFLEDAVDSENLGAAGVFFKAFADILRIEDVRWEDFII